MTACKVQKERIVVGGEKPNPKTDTSGCVGVVQTKVGSRRWGKNQERQGGNGDWMDQTRGEKKGSAKPKPHVGQNCS